MLALMSINLCLICLARLEVHGHGGKRLNNSILIPMKNGMESMAALRRARGLAQHDHSRLYLLHVVEPKETGDVLGAAVGASTHGMGEEDFAHAKSLLESQWRQLNEPMAAVDFIIKDGKLSETIAEEAHRLGVDTIILGTSKASPNWAGTIGKVKQSTPCKLTVVNQDEEVVLEYAP